MKRWVLLILVFFASTAFSAQEVRLGCKRLRVVLDARLRPEVVEQEWGSGNVRSEAPAVLEMAGCNGQLLDRIVLAAPLARLDPVPVRGAPNPTYLVSADLTAEAGSYNGPLTIPVQVLGDRLVAAVARVDNAHTEPMRLTQTGKSAWRRASKRTADELLFVSCRPRGQGFVTSYRRYFSSRQDWKVRLLTRQGPWESDGGFPGRKFFP